ncbi:MAG TPA: type II secretion system protein [Planctomycetota bacterium]|nr:type II secretion system protein [Planctomycetota bacterium]HRR80246.1 type II secretion system protein [Planctomycetota bacterium]HRT93106.1 type II secretion system protein [Planctomycetota bacterium]
MNTPVLGTQRLRRRAGRRAFTLVELLVVLGIISILAGLLLPAIVHSLATAELTNCLSNQRQIGQAMANYNKDFESWMVSAGARTTPAISVTGGTTAVPSYGPFVEPPYDYPAAAARCSTTRFPFWYAALAPYVNVTATWRNAVLSYLNRTGKKESEVTDDTYYHIEIARLCMMYTCPSKKQAVIGYGLNYAAPYGESILYPFNQAKYGLDYPATACSGAKFRNAADQNLAPDQQCWPYTMGNETTQPTGFTPYPNYMLGHPSGAPILWYGQSSHFSCMSDPSGQIAVCDTGLVTNDPVWQAYTTVPKWRPTEQYSVPTEWREHTAGLAAECWMGYTRFPLNAIYTGVGRTWADVWTPTKKKVGYYKYFYCSYTNDDNGINNPAYNTAWRPVPRHNKRTACLFFDGRVRPVDIMDIVSYEWGDRRCLFDNKPQTKMPTPRDDIFAELNGCGCKVYAVTDHTHQNSWLPERAAGGYVDTSK